MELTTSQVQHYKPHQDSLVEYLRREEIPKNFLVGLGYFGIFLSFFASFVWVSLDIALYLYTLAILYFFVAIGLYFYVEKRDLKEALIPNLQGQEYLLRLGTEVREFKGDAVKSAKAKGNLLRPVLVNAESVKRHFLCMATIGAGKSVLMKGLIEQYTILGGGCMIVDGKGSDEFAKEIYGLVASLGREDDFVYLNFLDMNNSHTINPLLSGSANALFEILQPLLAGEEDTWKSKAKELMLNVLKICVWKRDNEPYFIFDFSYLTKILNVASLAKLGLEYKHLAQPNNPNYDVGVEDYLKWLCVTLNIPLDDFLKAQKDDPAFQKRIDAQIAKGDGEPGIYSAGVSIGYWSKPLTTLASDYGRIFNAPHPDISLWEATQRNKIIFVTLPTMDSDTTPKELGRLLLALIKSVGAKKLKDAREPKIPFVCFLDELGSYVIEGFGRLESKSRSLGISIFPFFQSPAQIDVVAKNDYERKEIIDVTGVHILMKNLHPETTEFYAKMIPKKKIMNRDYVARRDFAKGQGAVEDTYKVEEKDAIEHNEVMNMNNGEMIIFANGKMHRAIAQAETSLLSLGKKTTYQGMSDLKIPLTQYVNKQEFFTAAWESIEAIESSIQKDIETMNG